MRITQLNHTGLLGLSGFYYQAKGINESLNHLSKMELSSKQKQDDSTVDTLKFAHFCDFPGGPAVLNPTSSVRKTGPTPGWGTKISHDVQQPSPRPASTEPLCPGAQEPQLDAPVQSPQSLSRVQLSVTPWTTACQASPPITSCPSLLKLMSIESVMPSNHLICHPLLLLPLILPSIRVFSTE